MNLKYDIVNHTYFTLRSSCSILICNLLINLINNIMQSVIAFKLYALKATEIYTKRRDFNEDG